jgi:hypothetical protein
VTKQEDTRPPNYPPQEPEGTQPRFPKEGVPSDEIVGNKGGTEADADEAHGTTDTGLSQPRRMSGTAEGAEG